MKLIYGICTALCIWSCTINNNNSQKLNEYVILDRSWNDSRVIKNGIVLENSSDEDKFSITLYDEVDRRIWKCAFAREKVYFSTYDFPLLRYQYSFEENLVDSARILNGKVLLYGDESIYILRLSNGSLETYALAYEDINPFGFNDNYIFFRDFYFDRKTLVRKNYPIELAYPKYYFHQNKIIAFSGESGTIAYIDIKDWTAHLYPLIRKIDQPNFSYSAQDLLCLNGNYLFFSKDSKSISNFFGSLGLVPGGARPERKWYSFDLDTNKINKVTFALKTKGLTSKDFDMTNISLLGF